MLIKIINDVLVTSTIDGGIRTISNNGKNIVENSMDVIFEKGEKAIENFFDPLIKVSSFIDDIFGW